MDREGSRDSEARIPAQRGIGVALGPISIEHRRRSRDRACSTMTLGDALAALAAERPETSMRSSAAGGARATTGFVNATWERDTERKKAPRGPRFSARSEAAAASAPAFFAASCRST